MKTLLRAALIILLACQSAAAETFTIDWDTKYPTWMGLEVLHRAFASETTAARNNCYLTMGRFGLSRVRIELTDEVDNGDFTYNYTTVDEHAQSIHDRVHPYAIANAGILRNLELSICYVGYSLATHPVQPNPHLTISTWTAYMVAMVARLESQLASLGTPLKVSFIEPCLEPDHTDQPITSVGTNDAAGVTLFGDYCTALITALDAAGYQRIKLIGPSCYQTAKTLLWAYTHTTNIEDNYPAVYARMAEISNHGYGGFTNPNFSTLISNTIAGGKVPSMTEYVGLEGKEAFDLVLAGVRRIQKFGPMTLDRASGGSNGLLLKNSTSSPDHTAYGATGDLDSPIFNTDTPSLSLLFESAKVGSQRIGTTRSGGSRTTMAFTRFDGKLVFILRDAPTTLSGTIAVTSGSPTVTGTSTSFTTQLSPGSKFVVEGDPTVRIVDTIASNTSLTLLTNIATTASGRDAYTSAPFTIAGLNPGTYRIKYATFETRLGSANPAVVDDGTFAVGRAGTSPSLDYPQASGLWIAIQQ